MLVQCFEGSVFLAATAACNCLCRFHNKRPEAGFLKPPGHGTTNLELAGHELEFITSCLPRAPAAGSL